MRRVLFIILLLHFMFSVKPSFSQTGNRDSLLFQLKEVNKSKEKIEILFQLFEEYEFDDDSLAELYLKQALDLSRRTNDYKGIARAYNYLGYLSEDRLKLNEALVNYYSSLKVSRLINDKAFIETAYHNIALVYHMQCKYDAALENNYLSLKYAEELKDTDCIASIYINLALVYEAIGNYPEALRYHLKSLKLEEELDDKSDMATSYNGIGIIYANQKKYDEALKNYSSSYKLAASINDKQVQAEALNNIGTVYNAIGKTSEALKYFQSAILLKEKVKDYKGIASTTANLGDIYYSQGKDSLALEMFRKSLKIYEETGKKSGISYCYNNMGIILMESKRLEEAEKLLNKAKLLSEEINHMDMLSYSFLNLSRLDSIKGDYKNAFINYRLYIKYKDSLDNEESRKRLVQTQMTYEFEKKEAVAVAEHKKELENQKAIADEKSKKQKMVILFVVFGLLLVIVFAGFILRSLRITRKQKNTIERQKHEVDEKNLQLNQQNEEIRTQRDEIEAQRDEIEAQRDLVTIQKVEIEVIHKEVTDSINYAKRIQEAVLPVSVESRSVLGEHFILFKPKDIVSGDFYWTTKVDKWLIVAVADCTGHGVPGAFMSMLGISFLNEIVQKKEVHQASQILNILRIEIINALQQKGVSGEQKDGMDISLLVINTETNECQWAGANNPIYVIARSDMPAGRQETSKQSLKEIASLSVRDDEKELYELKGNKMPIAIYPEMKDFTNHEFVLQKGDSVYLFTDGYADQFGGPKGRKFMYKHFKENLLLNCHKSMKEQKEFLEDGFNNWKLNFEQIDDVTVIGLKITQ